MKIKLLFTIILFCCFICHAFAQDSTSRNWSYYGGVNSFSVLSSDFENFDISDWENFGLRSQNPNSLEGRVRVNLADKNPSLANVGVLLGALLPLNKEFSMLVEFQYAFSGISLGGIFFGGHYFFREYASGRLAFTGKYGYNFGAASFGSIEQIRGYTAPVIIDEGRFFNGDALTMVFEGQSLNLGVSYFSKFDSKFNFFANAGLNISFGSSAVLKADGKTIPMGSKAVVKPDDWNNQAGLSPRYRPVGLGLQVGVLYRTNRSLK